MEILSKYDPNKVESKWYSFWLENHINYSEPDEKKAFTIVIPPPNITGALHMGHALNNTLQDIFIRFHKKLGFNTCWIPGTDHGGIATQNVLEKQLALKKIDKHEIGREKFLEMMWDWRSVTGDTILTQLRKLGCLCDWDKTRFTMDDDCGNAVFEAFKILFNDGLIYKGNYMVNWCPRCDTALSDIEVEHEHKEGSLWYIKYPLKESSEFIIVATTRPETMLGDSAVAVNPNDERYKNLIGKTLILPLINREIKIIADEMVDINFGTGAVKITPSHDLNDYETAKRHNLEFINVIDKKGKMTEFAGQYQGFDRYDARKKIVSDLEAGGFLEKIEKYQNNISICYRCSTVIEPLVSMQWYLNTKEMAKEAIKASKDRRIEFLPESWEKPYLNWMENLHDWCISRQIWWGHRIPIWYCQNCYEEGLSKGIIVSKDKPSICNNCFETNNFIQDEDVLDTWFSSGLWPFSTLGWPDKTDNLDYYYPTSVLATGHEILYLWVARMIMFGIKFIGDVPFKKVYIHGIVRDANGKKMSKSLGNVVDPLEIIEKYGTDSLRFSLTYNGIMGRDLQVSDESFIMSRNFCNKLWNASRFILTNLSEYVDGIRQSNSDFDFSNFISINEDFISSLEVSDRWILSEYENTKKTVLAFYKNSDFSMAVRELYEFIWSKYCDWYLEIAKVRIYNGTSIDKNIIFRVLLFVLKNVLNLLNPVIPFITEEINENINMILGVKNFSLANIEFINSENNFFDKDSVNDMENIIEIISKIRNVRIEMNVAVAKEIDVFISYKKDSCKIRDNELKIIKKLAKISNIIQGLDIQKPDKSVVCLTTIHQIYLPLEGLVDFEKEKNRLTKELLSLENEIAILDKKLDNKNFIERAAKQEVEKVYNKKEIAFDKIIKIKQNLMDME